MRRPWIALGREPGDGFGMGIIVGRPRQGGFTLVELLVVVAIIAILASLFLPTLAGAKERGKRTHCLSTQRQFVLATMLYAGDEDQRLPVGGNENLNKLDTHTPILSNETKTNVLRYAASLRTLDCPSLAGWMNRKEGWRDHDTFGIAIGYHYFGGHPATPWAAIEGTNQWISPQKTSESPTMPLLADLNVYCYSFRRILGPHSANGPIVKDEGYFDATPSANSQTPLHIGAKGGNIALLDGSAAWKPIQKMKAYRASHLWEGDGAFGLW